MGKILILLMIVVFVGCAEDPTENNYGYGFWYSEESELGQKIRWPASGDIPTAAELDDVFIKTADCAGLQYDQLEKPLVIFTDEMMDSNGPAVGLASWDTNSVFIYAGDYSKMINLSTYSHELLHIFLNLMGESVQDNFDHKSYLFNACDLSIFSGITSPLLIKEAE